MRGQRRSVARRLERLEAEAPCPSNSPILLARALDDAFALVHVGEYGSLLRSVLTNETRARLLAAVAERVLEGCGALPREPGETAFEDVEAAFHRSRFVHPREPDPDAPPREPLYLDLTPAGPTEPDEVPPAWGGFAGRVRDLRRRFPIRPTPRPPSLDDLGADLAGL